MKNSKKGISLIVLVITIIVIIILAAAVILTMSNNNPIAKANKAVSDSDLSEAQSALTLFLANVMADDSVRNSVDITPAGPLGSAKLKIHGTTDQYIAINETTGAITIVAVGDATPITYKDLGISDKVFAKLSIETNGVLKYTPAP